MNVKIILVMDLQFAMSLNLPKLSCVLSYSLRSMSCTFFRKSWPESLKVCRAPASYVQSLKGSELGSVELAVVVTGRSLSAINCKALDH